MRRGIRTMHYESQTVDQRPGPLPDIRMESDSVMYIMDLAALPKKPLLVIRCDAEGEVWISIGRDEPGEHRGS